METSIPLMPCGKLADALSFYRSFGFAVTHEQIYAWADEPQSASAN